MIIHVYVILLIVTLLWTSGVIYLGIQGSATNSPVNRRVGILLSAIGMILWGIVGISSFEVVSYSGGSTFEHEIVEMAWFALAGAALMLFSLVEGTIEELNETGGI